MGAPRSLPQSLRGVRYFRFCRDPPDREPLEFELLFSSMLPVDPLALIPALVPALVLDVVPVVPVRDPCR